MGPVATLLPERIAAAPRTVSASVAPVDVLVHSRSAYSLLHRTEIAICFSPCG